LANPVDVGLDGGIADEGRWAISSCWTGGEQGEDFGFEVVVMPLVVDAPWAGPARGW
jgi:hypothetical protein